MSKPNFTGVWKFNPTKSVLQIPAPDSTIFLIEHQEPVLHISRTHIVGEKSDTFTLDLTTDGKEVILDLDDLWVQARTYWDGEILVFDTNLVRAGKEATNLVRYKLADTLDMLIAEERLQSKELSYNNIWVLDKQ
ncbi:MAG: hypothetical protein AB1489_15645 [Acidobacteriota bacterium]